MKRTLVLLALAAGLLAAAAPAVAAPAAAWKGIVVAKDAQRGTVVTASANGVARTIRTPKSRILRLGQRLDVRATALADGTFKAVGVKVSGRAKTARMKAVVIRNQRSQQRLLVSAGGSTFALARGGKARTVASVVENGPQSGDRINATVDVTGTTPHATSVSTVGRLGVLEVEGILTKIDAAGIELIVAKAGFVTLALPAGFALPAGIAVFDEVKAHVAVGTDGKLTLLSLQSDDESDRDDDGVDVDDDGEMEVTGKITAMSASSVTVTPGSSSPVTCSLRKPLTGFAVGDRVEMECVAGASAGTLVLTEIEHEDDDEDDDDDDDDDDEHHGGDDD